MALSGTKKGTVTQNGAYYEYWLSWSAVQNSAENYSDVTVTHYWKQIKAKTFNTVGLRDYGITIDDGTGKADCTKSGSKVFDYDPWPSNAKISSYTKRVYHNDNGEKTITISTWANGHANSWGPSSTTTDSGDCKASVTVDLNDIPRKATLTYVPSFNDEQNPTITYNNAAGNVVELLQACISLDGSRDDVAYRDVSKTGSSYTFNLTNAERKVLREGTPENSRTVIFYLKTKLNGITYVSEWSREFTIINAKPTLTPNVYDNNSVTTALTGNNQKIVKYASNVRYEVNAVAKKEATIAGVAVSHNGKTVINTAGTWQSVESNKFIFDATDSRGNVADTVEVTLDMIDYIKLTCDVGNNKPDLNGNLTVACSGNYFNGSFGATNNSLTVQYRYKPQNGNYSSWTNMTTSISDQTYTATANVTGLSTQQAYVVQTRAIDKINTSGVNSIEKTVKYTPVFDWGENDFNINGDLNVNGNITVNGSSFMPVGSTYIGDEDPATLFGGTWQQVRTFYGGELIAFGLATATGGVQLDSGVTRPFSHSCTGTKTFDITNYVENMLTDDSSGTFLVQNKGIVGMVEAVMNICGQGTTNTDGVWFRGQYSSDSLPSGVTCLGGETTQGLMTGPFGANYGGSTHSYIYKVDTTTKTSFHINPSFSPYNGAITLSNSGTKCSLLVKVYAKYGQNIMYKRIS